MVTKHLEQLCEKEFALKQDEAYKGSDRELANLREHYAHQGLLVSSSRAQAVMDAVLMRFDKILDGFENIYLAKFSDPAKTDGPRGCHLAQEDCRRKDGAGNLRATDESAKRSVGTILRSEGILAKSRK